MGARPASRRSASPVSRMAASLASRMTSKTSTPNRRPASSWAMRSPPGVTQDAPV
jgi:hypothetical protein